MEQIVGTISGIESRNGGWTAVAISVEGSDYPKKLSTKKPEIISQAVALMGQLVTAAYNEVQSTTPNPHRPGEFYINRYLEALTPGAQPGVPTTAPSSQGSGTSGGGNWSPEKELRITRLACLKVSVEVWKTFEVTGRDLNSLVAVNEVLTDYAMTGSIGGAPAPAAANEPPPEDDIPF